MILLLSVVIPTYNREAILGKALTSLAPQVIAFQSGIEVIVVDDGSVDTTSEMVAACIDSERLPIRYLYQNNLGPAAARNKGLHAARGKVVLFLGDDSLAQPNLLRTHIKHHNGAQFDPKTAVLGKVVWDPSLEISPFMRWWGQQRLRYPATITPCFVEPWRFYTCNVSVNRDFLLSSGGFDEEFVDAAFEDTELALRLASRGLKLYFSPAALVHHHHPTNLSIAQRQMETVGRNYDLVQRKTRSVGLPRTWRWIGRGFWMSDTIVKPLTNLAERLQYRVSVPGLWVIVLMYSFLVGRGLRPRIE